MTCYSQSAVQAASDEAEPRTLDQPPTPATAPRKLICLRLIERATGIKLRATERCANERLPGSDLCARCLGEAAADYGRIIVSARKASQ